MDWRHSHTSTLVSDKKFITHCRQCRQSWRQRQIMRKVQFSPYYSCINLFVPGSFQCVNIKPMNLESCSSYRRKPEISPSRPTIPKLGKESKTILRPRWMWHVWNFIWKKNSFFMFSLKYSDVNKLTCSLHPRAHFKSWLMLASLSEVQFSLPRFAFPSWVSQE